ncbi:MAG: hypothetical protein ISP90_14860 [Nevskia sp.]|nr:hypothetical protein [Nevskia sp.]
MVTHFASLVAAAAVWGFMHIGISGTPLRARLVALLGAGPYRGLFSLGSAAGLFWLARSFGASGPGAVLWQLPPWATLACMLLMLPALLLFVGALTTPNPTMIAGERALAAAEPARGILRVTRHPMLCSFVAWSAVHILANGTLAGLVFFGTFGLVALAGMPSIDRKRAQTDPAGWAPFAQRSSILPFAAIAQGRNRFVFGEIGLWRVALAAAAWFGLIALHPLLFHVSPGALLHR